MITRVAEIHRAPLAIRQSPVGREAEQHVENISVRLFDFIEEDDCVRTTPNRFSQLAALFVPDISWRARR